MPPFVFVPLNDPLDIRVLEISPAEDTNADIGAAFRTESLAPDAAPDYDALSYMWGDQADRVDIFLDGCTFSVSRHLCRALRALRRTSHPRRLWVDAICIHQNDIDERNQQVQLMRAIYRRAKRVVIWLNRDIDAQHVAFQYLATFSHASQLSDLGDDPDLWDPLRDVFKDPYWERVWIQQEIRSAASLSLFCHEAELSIFCIYHWLRLYQELQLLDILGPSWQDWAVKMPSVRLPRRFAFVNSHIQPREMTLDEKASDILETLSGSNNLKCTDERDRVYGMMFLAQDCHPGDIKVDYNLTTAEVFTQVAEFVISKYRSSRFLLYSTLDHNSTNAPDTPPSWVPDWRRPPARPSMPRPLPPLSRSRPTMHTQLPLITDGILSLYAIKVDTILKTYQDLFTTDLLSQTITQFIAACTTITEDLLTSTSPPTSSPRTPGLSENTPEWNSVIHTLAGADNQDKQKHPDLLAVLSRGAEELLSLSRERTHTNQFDPDTCILGRIVILPKDKGVLQLAKTFLTFTWWGMVQKRVPFLTAKGRVGMAPHSADVGDEVWLVPGCEMPLLVRGGEVLVGEVYLDGANDWEPVGGYKGLDEVGEGMQWEQARGERLRVEVMGLI